MGDVVQSPGSCEPAEPVVALSGIAAEKEVASLGLLSQGDPSALDEVDSANAVVARPVERFGVKRVEPVDDQRYRRLSEFGVFEQDIARNDRSVIAVADRRRAADATSVDRADRLIVRRQSS